MNLNGMPVSSSPAVTPMIASGMTSQIRSVARIELNRHTKMNTMSARKYGSGRASAARASRESSYSPPHSSE